MMDQTIYDSVSKAIGYPVDNVVMCNPKYELHWMWKILNVINPFFKTVAAAQMTYLATVGPNLYLVIFQKKQPYVRELPLSGMQNLKMAQIQQGMSTQLTFQCAGEKHNLVAQSYLPYQPSEYDYGRITYWYQNLMNHIAMYGSRSIPATAGYRG